MEAQKAYLVGIHRYSFRAGVPGEIIGVEFVSVNGTSRAAYRVRFEDGKEDLVAIEDRENYAIISESDMLAGMIPQVVN